MSGQTVKGVRFAVQIFRNISIGTGTHLPQTQGVGQSGSGATRFSWTLTRVFRANDSRRTRFQPVDDVAIYPVTFPSKRDERQTTRLANFFECCCERREHLVCNVVHCQRFEYVLEII